MTDITLTDTPHGLHLDVPGSPGLTISPDEVAAIVSRRGSARPGLVCAPSPSAPSSTPTPMARSTSPAKSWTSPRHGSTRKGPMVR